MQNLADNIFFFGVIFPPLFIFGASLLVVKIIAFINKKGFNEVFNKTYKKLLFIDVLVYVALFYGVFFLLHWSEVLK